MVVVLNVSYFFSPTSSGRALKVEIKKVLGIDEDFVVRRDDKGRPGTSLSYIVMIFTISKRHNVHIDAKVTEHDTKKLKKIRAFPVSKRMLIS